MLAWTSSVSAQRLKRPSKSSEWRAEGEDAASTTAVFVVEEVAQPHVRGTCSTASRVPNTRGGGDVGTAQRRGGALS